MGVLELVVLGGVLVAAVGGAAVAVGVLAARGRTRRNQVVPGVPTNAPASWAGAHIPEARLHRRLRAAVGAARSVADPDGSLIEGRVEIERAALATDDHLVTLSLLTERERAGRLADVEAAVASVEAAAASLADAANLGRGGATDAVQRALDRARLVQEARRELDAGPQDVLGGLGGAASAPSSSPAPGPDEATPVDAADDDEPPRPRAQPG